MYDLVITHMLEWASLSVEWLPIFEVAEDPDLRIHNLILGTDSPEGDKNYMLIAKVNFQTCSLGHLGCSWFIWSHSNRVIGENTQGEHHG